MKIKQYGRKIISNKEIFEIINLMKKDNKNFKYNDIKKVIIWNSKLLYKLYMILTFQDITNDYLDVINNKTKAAYYDFKKIVHVYLFNGKIDYINKHEQLNNEDKNMIQTLKLACVYYLSHEFRHNYQSIFSPHRYLHDKAIYYLKEWEEHWIEKDAIKYSKQFMLNNQKKLNEILEINFRWKL